MAIANRLVAPIYLRKWLSGPILDPSVPIFDLVVFCGKHRCGSPGIDFDDCCLDGLFTGGFMWPNRIAFYDGVRVNTNGDDDR